MPKSESSDANKSQVDKFREAARDLETDESEANFDRLVKKIARPESAKQEKRQKS